MRTQGVTTSHSGHPSICRITIDLEYWSRRCGAGSAQMCTHCQRVFALAVLAAGFLSGCIGGKVIRGYDVPTGGYAKRGEQVMVQYRCGSCHAIPGIPNANGVFGPPLVLYGRRTFIAGEFPNTTENLVKWIMSPPSMKPKTAMPALGVSEEQARDAAAYLYTLK